MKNVEQPVTVQGRFGEETTHPAFGQIIIRRVEGHGVLYGSDFEHNGYIDLSIHESTLQRSLAHDRPSAGRLPVVRISLSESQWVSMISSIGRGEGTPCTIAQLGAKQVPSIPTTDKGQTYKKEATASLAEVIDCLDTLEADVVAATGRIPKGTQSGLVDRIRQARAAISSRLPFIADSFSEHIQRRVDSGKLELEGWIARRSTSHPGLASTEPSPLRLSSDSDDDV